MSNCLHGNGTQEADWFRPGTDFVNQKRNDFTLVGDDGGQPGGWGSHCWTLHFQRRSFFLGGSAKKSAETKTFFWATSRKSFEQERRANPADTMQLNGDFWEDVKASRRFLSVLTCFQKQLPVPLGVPALHQPRGRAWGQSLLPRRTWRTLGNRM